MKFNSQALILASLTCGFILIWQFAQFSLLTQLVVAFALFAFDFAQPSAFETVIKGQIFGLIAAYVLMFGNEMLITSLFFSFLVVALAFFKTLSGERSRWKATLALVTLPIAALGLKLLLGKAFDVRDDVRKSVQISRFSTRDALYITNLTESFCTFDVYVDSKLKIGISFFIARFVFCFSSFIHHSKFLYLWLPPKKILLTE